jgi:protoporphyrinogen oxidase
MYTSKQIPLTASVVRREAAARRLLLQDKVLMAAIINHFGVTAICTDGHWTSEDQNLADLFNAHRESFHRESYHPNPDEGFAEFIVARLGGKVIFSDPTDYIDDPNILD